MSFWSFNPYNVITIHFLFVLIYFSKKRLIFKTLLFIIKHINKVIDMIVNYVIYI